MTNPDISQMETNGDQKQDRSLNLILPSFLYQCPHLLQYLNPDSSPVSMTTKGPMLLCFKRKCSGNQRVSGNQNREYPITLVVKGLLCVESRAKSSSLLNPFVTLEKGSWIFPPANETRNLFSPNPKRTRKEKKWLLIRKPFLQV